ncbi:UTP:RNA uridylyltransferase 1-like isoform X2 [Mangifera indica]|uniref:UTP:RNA uridylyltransferase 1-like isoform X2 n=1 Tax=Mangifera indica TaxID=29780 RepID=UPI001CF9EF11|nr:UTP:RNA uridylyltransferase 1-like isoform X2 [Mangifera indica]
MTGGGGDAQPPLPWSNGGEFLLSLLQKSQQQPQTQSNVHQLPSSPVPINSPNLQLPDDPAVAAVGPSLNFPVQWPSKGFDLPPPWSHNLSPPFPHNFLGFPQNHWQSPPGNQRVLNEDFSRLGISNASFAIQNLVVPQQQNLQEQHQKLLFGSLQAQNPPAGLPSNLDSLDKLKYDFPNGLDWNNQFEPRRSPVPNQNFVQHLDNSVGKQHDTSAPPPGFLKKSRGGGIVGGNSWRGSQFNVDKEKVNCSVEDGNGRVVRLPSERTNAQGLTGQFDHPGPPSRSNLHSVAASGIEESMSDLHREDGERHRMREKVRRETGPGYGRGGEDLDDFDGEPVDSLLPDDASDYKNDLNDRKQPRRDKESRRDNRGKRLLSQRMRSLKWQLQCRSNIDGMNSPFLAIYESLIPPEEEKAKQKQLLASLEKLVCKEWPDARLYLYGSCANSFGVSKSDIDVCLAIDDPNINKSEVLLKLADILESDNLQNVQALTRARVPIVKLMDPVTGISCDICINNLLAVVNTKLLQDYAQIDVRLRQLAFIVKHWAKSRGVNETYHGTLSSYAYVLMCIHFLQQRRPAILPCLQFILVLILNIPFIL